LKGLGIDLEAGHGFWS